MTATDRLRALLDERGVEHYDGTNGTLWGKDAIGYRFSADELTSGRMSVHMWCETPEQAVEATLGSGTCKLTMDGTDGCFGCSECLENIPPLANYCPNCGRKVVE